MITKINSTIENLKNLFIETFLNKTKRVSDIAPGSVTNAVAYGCAKIAQKAIKDIAIVEAQLFPDSASGEYLDRAAELFGVGERGKASPSSTYIRVLIEKAKKGEVAFNKGDIFSNTNNIRFIVSENTTLYKANGYGYVPVTATATGSITNVSANTIVKMVSQPPQGFISCTNEYMAIGGRDYESDEDFRIRIKNNLNVLSTSTQEYLLQAMQKINPNILKILYIDSSLYNGITIGVVTQNGALLAADELAELKDGIGPHLPLSNIDSSGNVIGFNIKNVDWYWVGGENGIYFAASLSVTGDKIKEVAEQIQISMTKYLDFKYWNPGQKIYWDDLLRIVKNTPGVESVPNTSFYPNKDEEVPQNQLPRIKRFVMTDLSGNSLFDINTEEGTPVFYSK